MIMFEVYAMHVESCICATHATSCYAQLHTVWRETAELRSAAREAAVYMYPLGLDR